jgi:hypothetical protein
MKLALIYQNMSHQRSAPSGGILIELEKVELNERGAERKPHLIIESSSLFAQLSEEMQGHYCLPID